MATLDRPLLRALSGRRIDHQGEAFVALEDSLGLFSGQVLIPLDAFQHVIRHFDGHKSLDEIRLIARRESGQDLSIDDLKSLVARLDLAMVLDGPTVAAFSDNFARMEARPAAMAGRSYPAHEKELRADLARYFSHPKGAGLCSEPKVENSTSLRAIISPHIDFGRGGPVYSWAYRELLEKSDADIFVVLGVAHQYCRHRFALTRKDFETPLGTVRTDRAFVDHIAEMAGVHHFEDELAHRTEHSIEFQAVFLQYILGQRRNFTMVPVLVGSFHDLMERGIDPIQDAEIGRMVAALRFAEIQSGKKVAYIGAIDLCHVGPEFGDPALVDEATLDQIRTFDHEMLDLATTPDADGWFARAAEINNRWRVCGLAAMYTMLQAMGPAQGRVLSYEQAINPTRSCCVSFASVVFDSTEDDPATHQ